MKYKNKLVGAKVVVDKVLIAINPTVKWKYMRRVPGIIVERGDYEQYYHTSSGGNTYATKHIIKDDCFKTFAIKLDNDVVDIEGNNIIVVREFNLKFLESLPDSVKIISKKDYNNAMKLIEEYKRQQEYL